MIQIWFNKPNSYTMGGRNFPSYQGDAGNYDPQEVGNLAEGLELRDNEGLASPLACPLYCPFLRPYRGKTNLPVEDCYGYYFQ